MAAAQGALQGTGQRGAWLLFAPIVAWVALRWVL